MSRSKVQFLLRPPFLRDEGYARYVLVNNERHWELIPKAELTPEKPVPILPTGYWCWISEDGKIIYTERDQWDKTPNLEEIWKSLAIP